ncbi:hypothetical protein [Streptomyces sp. NPDC048106]|uniref:DUF11 domain-containing protein n=1 Tax=Streptomyces sp. NPDC048106 TaxID=3155750 RepID=UPI003456DCC1
MPVVGAGPAQAVPGDSFDPAVPYVFISHGEPTQLSREVVGPGGVISFEPVGARAPIAYNGIGYREADHFLYGVVTRGDADYPTGGIIRIGQDGVFSRVGTAVTDATSPTNWGTMVGDRYFWFGNGGNQFSTRRYDFTTGQLETADLSAVPLGTPDLAYSAADGYLWGLNQSGQIVRVDPSSVTGGAAAVTRFPKPAELPVGGYGSNWFYGNGDMGALFTDTGHTYQIHIADGASAHPRFTVVGDFPGPVAPTNDGAASPGLPVNLGITKTGPTAFTPGRRIKYRLQVTNHGPGLSSAQVVTDTLPSSLSDITTSSPGCHLDGHKLTCETGELAAGRSHTITVHATTSATEHACLINRASVVGQQTDPGPGNDTATFRSCPLPCP